MTDNTYIYKYIENNKDNDYLNNVMIRYLNGITNPLFFKNIGKHNISRMINRSDYPTFVLYHTIFYDDKYDIIYDIINNIADNDQYNKDQQHIFILTICLKNIELLNFILSKNFNINQNIDIVDDINILSISILEDDIDNKLFYYLIDHGADIHNQKMIVFKYACERKNMDVIKYLLNFDIPNKLLIKSITEMVDLYDSNSDDNIIIDILNILFTKIDQDKYGGYISILLARCNFEKIEKLIDCGIQVNISIESLKAACYCSNINFVEYHLKNGIEINKEILQYILDKAKLDLLILLSNYSADLSINKEINDYDTIINNIELCGLDKNILINILFKKVRSDNNINRNHIFNTDYIRFCQLQNKNINN